MAEPPPLPQGPATHPPAHPVLPAPARNKPPAARRLGLAPPPRAPAGAIGFAGAGGSAVDPASLEETLAAPPPAPTKKPTRKRVQKVPAATAARTAKKAAPPPPPPAPAMEARPPPPPVALTSPPPPLAAPTPSSGQIAAPQLVSGSCALTVFGEMAPSMDDESFLNYTCGQQFAQNGPSQEFPQDDPSQEFAQDDIMGDGDGEGDGDGDGFLGEGDGEGFVGEAYGEGFVNDPTPRRASRGANFTKKEDETLCHAWIFIGVDPITGNEQQSNTYWERIHEYYRQYSKKARTIISLQHRWSTINSECFKWYNCLAPLERLNPSGTSAIDKLNITQKLFMGKPKKKGGKPGKAFTLFHCFTILEKEEKWKNRPSNEIPNKRKTPTTPVGEDLVVDTDDEGSSSPTPLSSVNRKRPVEGRKKAKEARAKGGENMYKDSLDNMMAVRKELANERRAMRHKEIEERKVSTEERRAAAEEKRLELEESKVANEEMLKRMEQEQKLMFMDPSSLDEKGRAYWELCCDQILMARGYGGDGNGGGGGI